MRKAAFTMMELMVVTVIMILIFSAVFTIFFTSDRSWRTGQNKLIEQQEARRAMDSMVRLLRESAPDWGGGTYPVSITSNNRIDFYMQGKKVTFKLNPDNPRQLLKKEGNSDPVVIGNEIESLSFGGGCSGCAAYNCSSVANDCPVVKIEVQTSKDRIFTLKSLVNLRNRNITLANDTVVEEPGQGEF